MGIQIGLSCYFTATGLPQIQQGPVGRQEAEEEKTASRRSNLGKKKNNGEESPVSLQGVLTG